MPNYIKIPLLLILLLSVVAFIVYSMVDMTEDAPDELCSDVELIVEDGTNTNFIDKASVEQLLHQANLYPKGCQMNSIDTRRIEAELRKNSFVKGVECYKTTRGLEIGKGKVCIKVTQRNPVLLVLPESGSSYYVDDEGNVIANTAYVKNIIVATGKIDQKYAAGELSTFATYIQNDPFWDNQLEQIHVTEGKNHTHRVTLIPRVGEHSIILGAIDDYEKKLDRLKVFYEEGLSKVGWNKYSKISVEFKNQVVCTKR